MNSHRDGQSEGQLWLPSTRTDITPFRNKLCLQSSVKDLGSLSLVFSTVTQLHVHHPPVHGSGRRRTGPTGCLCATSKGSSDPGLWWQVNLLV